MNLLKKKISFRVALVILLSSFFIASIFSTFDYFSLQKQQIKFFEHSIKQLVIIINDTASIASYLNNTELAQDVVNGLIKNDMIYKAQISGKTGLNVIALREENNNNLRQTRAKTHQFILYSPFDEEEVVGELNIQQNKKFIDSHTKQVIFKQSSSLLIYTLLIATFVFILLNYILIQPIKHISHKLNKLTLGKQERINPLDRHTEDEIGQLIIDINKVLQGMQDSLSNEQELRIHSEELNQELQTANIDITEKQTLLKEAITKAEQANQFKSDFLANMSHELRTPMHGILSFASMGIKRIEKSPTEKNLRYFTNIKTSTDRLMVLLNDLLDLAKLEAGKMEMNFSQSSLTHVVDSCIAEQQARLEELKLKIHYSENNVAGEGVFDGTRIGQVITNFLSNAIKFSPEGSKISITIKDSLIDIEEFKNQPALFFSVKDNGKGIPEGECKLVFDKFIQSSDTTIGTTKGTGLGLPISKEIIDLHQGIIWAENHPDGGAIFRFIIPIQQIEILATT